MVPFEDLNVEAYRLLLRLEVAIREVLRIALFDQFGQNWQRQLLQSQKVKIRAGQVDEAKRKQFDYLKLGPLYYLTLGELLPLLKQKQPAIAQAVTEIGGESIIQQLESTLGPRNAVAHSRSVSVTGLAAIKSLNSQFETAVGEDRLRLLLENPDCGVWPEDAVPMLRQWVSNCEERVKRLSRDLPSQEAVLVAQSQYWWASPGVCPFDTSPVESAVLLMQKYANLYTGIGSAGIRQQFVEEKEVLSVLGSAARSLEGNR